MPSDQGRRRRLDSAIRNQALCALLCMSCVALGAARAVHAQDPEAQPPDAEREANARRLLELHTEIAWRTLNRGANELAEAMFRDILRRDPNRPREIAGLSAALARQGKVGDAITVLNDGVARFPTDVRLTSALGQAYLNRGDLSLAMCWLERAYCLDPGFADTRFFLGSTYLKCQYPMLALDYLCGGPTSSTEMAWTQNLSIGLAFGQLGLQSEARGYFTHVAGAARGTPLEQNAQHLQRELDQALCDREYVRGSLRITGRYDSNPGVIPATNAVGGALGETPSWGNQYVGEVQVDLLRENNFDLTSGYRFLHTSNYEAHRFDLLDNGLYVAATRRSFRNGMPVFAGFRADYDNLLVGSNEFLSRVVATPTLTVMESDRDSTTLLARYTFYDFLGQGGFDGTPLDLDANNIGVGLLQQRQSWSRRVKLLGGYYYDHSFSQGSDYDYDGHKLQLGLQWKTSLNDLRVNALGEFYYRDYLNPNSVFGRERVDLEYLATVGVLYPLHDDWLLAVEYNFDRNDSNVPTNDYRRHVIDFGVEYRFPHGRREP